MAFYLIILLILLGLFISLIIWIYRLFKLYKKGKKKSFTIQTSILVILIIFVTWELQIFPLSKNFYIKGLTTELTGKAFWSWKEFYFNEWSVRNEGYTLYIYKFGQETANYFEKPDSVFFNNFPPENLTDIRWTPTPVKNDDLEVLDFVTPVYGGWKGEIVTRQDFIKQIATKPGSYYAYRHAGSTDFYLISPQKRLIIWIFHNM